MAQVVLVITCQLLQLERCSNPLRIQQVYLFRVKKNFQFWVRGFLLGGRHKWGYFRVFMAYFNRPWTPIEWAHMLDQIFL